jgi:hypothetical protein
MRSRLLIRLFLWRFLEHDLVSPDSDRRGILSAIGGALVAVSLFMAVLIAWKYQLVPALPPGLTSIWSLDDRFLFVTSSMLVMALAAVAEWDALVLDARDVAVLGVLPIPRGAIVRTKFAATALFAAAVLAAWNVFPGLLRFAAVPSGLRVGLAGSVTLTLAQAAVTLAAGAFGFLAVLGLREVAFAILGATLFRKISAAVQALLIVGLTTALLLLPGASDIAARWRTREKLAARAAPPSWFVGLHETVAGSVIDSLPRATPERYLIRQERDATALYRGLWPLYRELATTAVTALSIIAITTTAACLWNTRRLPAAAASAVSSDRLLSRVWNWIVVHVIARTPLRQAGFFFTLQTLLRRVPHRVLLATAWAVGLALTVVAAGGGGAVAVDGTRSIPVAILAAQSLLLGCLLYGFRRATRVPSELRATSTFSLAWSGNASPFISGVKCAGWVAVVAPALFGLSIWHTAILGLRLAALHLAVGVSLSALLMQTLFVRCRRVPFVNSYGSTVDPKLRLAGFLFALFSGSFAVAGIERWSFGGSGRYWTLLAILVGLTLILALSDRLLTTALPTIELDEEPSFTQRLDLAR